MRTPAKAPWRYYVQVPGAVILALAAYLYLFASPVVEAIARGTAFSTALALRLLGSSASASGTLLVSEGFSFNVITECTAFGPLLLYGATVLSFPAPWRAKIWGLVLGIAVLSVINLVRMVSLVYVASLWPDYFDTAHFLVWQSLIVVAAIALWLFWMGRFAHVS